MADEGAWYAVIDGAQDPRLHHLVQTCREHACLLSGKLDPRMAATAPWLVSIRPDEALLRTWQIHGRGLSWGIMCQSSIGLDALRRHFRQFLQAQLPDGTIALFRFYDPRVLATFLRTASPDELAPWFAGIRQFAVEEPGGNGLVRFALASGKLQVAVDGVGAAA